MSIIIYICYNILLSIRKKHMCGIVGYTGKQNAKEVLLNGLKRLEYRGYDSAGVAILSNKKIQLRRSEGKIAKLESILKNKNLFGTTGVGHTRWATHGRPTEENAHPHTDCTKSLVVVHNGIIENYIALKKRLQKQGHNFRSETDTEVIAHLIEKNLKRIKTKALIKAVQMTIKELKGSYAIAVISTDDPEKVVVARQFSPLIIGLGDNESFVASDIPAILEHTRNVITLDDGETAELHKNHIQIYSPDYKKITKKASRIPWDPVTAEKGGFKHFMLKEIFEQPRSVEETFRGRLSLDSGEVFLEESKLTPSKIKGIQKIHFVACGTAYHACMIGKYLVENLAKIPCEASLGSEFRYSKPLVDNKTFVIIITQSGETADTLAALREAK
ncbi:MAG: glutamine--fructose-6-phosphate transaminase (isomerizing), partial [Bacteroidales bacterium]|nr:glutamine--fructose-6-phosphate transaminase (isomerizing) [Bacteroidales bacterium]